MQSTGSCPTHSDELSKTQRGILNQPVWVIAVTSLPPKLHSFHPSEISIIKPCFRGVLRLCRYSKISTKVQCLIQTVSTLMNLYMGMKIAQIATLCGTSFTWLANKFRERLCKRGYIGVMTLSCTCKSKKMSHLLNLCWSLHKVMQWQCNAMQ